MMEIDHWFPQCVRSGIHSDSRIFFPLAEGQSVDTQQITISRLHNMFLRVVAKQGTEFGEIGAGGKIAVERFLLRSGLS